MKPSGLVIQLKWAGKQLNDKQYVLPMLTFIVTFALAEEGVTHNIQRHVSIVLSQPWVQLIAELVHQRFQNIHLHRNTMPAQY